MSSSVPVSYSTLYPVSQEPGLKVPAVQGRRVSSDRFTKNFHVRDKVERSSGGDPVAKQKQTQNVSGVRGLLTRGARSATKETLGPDPSL